MLKKLLPILTLLFVVSSLTFGQNQYLGVDNTSASCSNCHSETATAWEGTGHAIAQDSVSSSHYGYSCLQCHNTGWNPDADNGGADEYVEQDTTQTPDYVVTDQEGWDRMKNVQCESCHGPAGNSAGDGLASDHYNGGLNVDYSAESCGSCHQGEHHPYLEQWQESMHAESDVAFFTRENNGDCYYCHYAEDFVAFLNDPEYDGTTFEPAEGTLNNLTCATCHNPHGNENPGNMRALPEGHEGHVICDVCHNAEIEGEVDVESTPHHTTSEVLDGAPTFGYQYEGEEYSSSYHSNIEERCVACHVNMTPGEDEIANTGHTFEPRVEACQECHGDYELAEGNFDYRGTQTMVQDLMDSLKTKLDIANASDSATTEFKRAKYNYLSVQAEGSMGIHNTDLVVGLLEDALARFTPTSVKADEGVTPERFELSQNYPNPFNPKTNIKFSVPEPTNVRVVVYNTLGKEVTTLVDKHMSTGQYTVSWDGSNYSSGIYLYKLETDKFSQVKKMLLVK